MVFNLFLRLLVQKLEIFKKTYQDRYVSPKNVSEIQKIFSR